MSKQIATLTKILVMLLLLSTFTLAFNIQQVKTEPTTWTVDDDGPADFSTIQEAINAANSGDTIYVSSGTYIEHVVVNKTVSLIGENRVNTIIDGNETGHVVVLNANNVNICNFTIENAGYSPGTGVISSSVSNSISQNIIRNNWWGIILSSNNIVTENLIIYNTGGIYAANTYNNTISRNNITRNGSHRGISLFASSYNNIIGNNITDHAGRLSCGIHLGKCAYNNIYGNNITGNWIGIEFFGLPPPGESEGDWYCDNNIVSGNNIMDNGGGWGAAGILVEGANNNLIYHNNFAGNSPHIYDCDSSANILDNGYPSGGNYWSDYNGTDFYNGLYQNETGSDGIGDIPYVIDTNHIDNYPLMNPWTLVDTIPPIMSITSPENATYTTTSIPLIFNVNEPTSWIGYSLDNQPIVTITGNITLDGLSDGPHSLVVYADDTAVNTGVSETIYFTIEPPQPFQPWVIAAIVIAVAFAAVLVFRRTKT